MDIQIHRALKRLRDDFQLSIITLMGIFGVLGISPYAVYRLSNGDYVVGIADCVIVLSTVFAVSYAWVTNDTVKPGIYLAIIFSIAGSTVAIKLGVNGLFWVYPLMLFNFFMVSPGKALLSTGFLHGSLLAHALLVPGSVFASQYQMGSFLVTGAMASILAFIFAHRTRTQRDQLQQLAIRDPLTGAGNRRAMNEELSIAAAGKKRHQTNYGVLVMDLDHFKQINDRFGHHVGDQVLTSFVEIVEAHSRKEDRLFRFGGEEFLLLLPNTDADGLYSSAQHLRCLVESQLTSPAGAVTVSIGGAILQPGESVDSWLQRADQSLYQAKSAGRNRVVIAANAVAGAPAAAIGEAP